MLIPTLLFFILYGFVFLIKDKKLRLFWELRLYYTLLLLIIGAYLYILFNSGVSFTNVKSFEINENFLKNLFASLYLFLFYKKSLIDSIIKS